MSSRFNTLLHGPAAEAASLLEYTRNDLGTPENIDELRVALINALRRIAQLEQECAKHER